MYNIADLHIHSNFSDGSMEPRQIIDTAKKLRIAAVSITDHDTLKGQEETLFYGEKYGIHTIVGVEITAFSQELNRKIHILGYGIKNMKMVEDYLARFLKSRNEASKKRIEIIQRNGYPIDIYEVKKYLKNGDVIYKQHIMHALVDRGYATTIYGELYEKLFGKYGIAVVESDYVDVYDAIRLVKEAGGNAVLAHPFMYDSMPILGELIQNKLDGIECYHPTADEKRRQIIMQHAEQNNLFITGGSDFHGFYNAYSCRLGSKNNCLPYQDVFLNYLDVK